MKNTRICPNCQNEFIVSERVRKYCSKECRIDYKSILNKTRKYERRCPICKAVFYTTTKKTKYCSIKCSKIPIIERAKKKAQQTKESGEKRCSKCKKIKSIDEFYPNKQKTDGFDSWCKRCKLDQNKQYAKNPEVAARKKVWREKYNISTKDLRRFSRMKRLYGVTFEKYMKMMDVQNGKCAICKDKLNMKNRGIHIDHCHDTDEVRGLLCKSCNSGLGFFRDNKEFLRNAIKYLDCHKKEEK